MKATYEFICDERPVVTILDGDAAGDKTRRALQQYLGNKNIPFDANKDFVSLHAGFALEGLFPHNWIIDAYNEHPGWFKEYSVDVEGRLLPFDLKSNQTKHQLRNHLISKSEADKSMSWIAKFEQVFDVVEKALHNQYIKVYGGEM